MSQKHQHDQVRSRDERFSEKIPTRIWQENASKDNPYVAESVLCHGYDLIELIQKRSFVDVFFLLFKGDLPSRFQAGLLEKLMIGLINVGPRHHATRAAMNAGVGKTDPMHILPIGISVLGGTSFGGGIVESSMRFLRKSLKSPPEKIAECLLAEMVEKDISSQNDKIDFFDKRMPGFGQVYGGIDLVTENIVNELVRDSESMKVLEWAYTFCKILKQSQVGWLRAGVAAAVFADLGFNPRAGGIIFQLINAPGIAAHGLELSNKPFTSMPFIKDENYVIEE